MCSPLHFCPFSLWIYSCLFLLLGVHCLWFHFFCCRNITLLLWQYTWILGVCRRYWVQFVHMISVISFFLLSLMLWRRIRLMSNFHFIVRYRICLIRKGDRLRASFKKGACQEVVFFLASICSIGIFTSEWILLVLLFPFLIWFLRCNLLMGYFSFSFSALLIVYLFFYY